MKRRFIYAYMSHKLASFGTFSYNRKEGWWVDRVKRGFYSKKFIIFDSAIGKGE